MYEQLKWKVINYLTNRGFEFEYSNNKVDKYQDDLRDEAISPVRYDGEFYLVQFRNIRFWFLDGEIVNVKELVCFT